MRGFPLPQYSPLEPGLFLPLGDTALLRKVAETYPSDVLAGDLVKPLRDRQTDRRGRVLQTTVCMRGTDISYAEQVYVPSTEKACGSVCGAVPCRRHPGSCRKATPRTARRIGRPDPAGSAQCGAARAPGRKAPSLPQLVGHEDRQLCMLQNVLGRPAKDHLAQPALSVGALHQKIGPQLA
jgi:hypothetical protein